MQQRQGDVLSKVVQDRLEQSQPFPGDLDTMPVYQSQFCVYRNIDRNTITIEDHLCGIEHDIPLEFALMANFAPGNIWNELCATEALVPPFEDMDYPRMGGVLVTSTIQTLARHLLFIPEVDDPGYTSRDNYVVYKDSRKRSFYIIEDIRCDFKTRISVLKLLNLKFNLPGWYKKQLERAENELVKQFKGPIEYKFLTHLFYGDPEGDFELELDHMVEYSDNYLHLLFGNLDWEERNGLVFVNSLASSYIEPHTYPGLQRNAGIVKEIGKLVPRPIVIVAKINGHSVRVLVVYVDATC